MQKIQSDVKNDPVSDNESPKDDWHVSSSVSDEQFSVLSMTKY